MKLHPDKSAAQNIRAYGPGWIAVNQSQHTSSLLLGSDGLLLDWACDRFEALNATHFEQITVHAKAMGAELVIFGSGQRLRFMPSAWLAGLMAQRIGLETMDTPAACRTYNVLANEGRKVLAALVLESGE